MDKHCNKVAAYCVCALAEGHEGPHTCLKDDCGGMWTGDINKPKTFHIVAMPGTGVPE